MIFKRWYPAILTAVMLVLLAAVWIIFAPIQLGGQAAYVIITGNSMEPGFRTGDLVIVRRATVYQVGDAVAYDNAELKRIVFHRIIGNKLGRFIFKGDHNTWTDSYAPIQAELIGRLWIHLPSVGKAVQWARQPLNFTVIAAALGGLFMGTLLLDKSKKDKKGDRRNIGNWLNAGRRWLVDRLGESRRKGKETAPEIIAETNMMSRFHASDWNPETQRPVTVGKARTQKAGGRFWDGMVEGLFFVLGLLGFGSVLLGIFAFTRPVLRTVADDISYQQIGVFSYSAAATPGIYDSETIKPVEPIFPTLTCILNLSFNYVLVGEKLEGLSGTQQIQAEVVDEASGWQRTLPLTEAVAFTGNSTSARTSLNLCDMQALATKMEEATGYAAPSYTLRIVPQISISGKVKGRNLQDTFKPALVFQFDRLHAWLVKSDPNADPLNPNSSGLLKGTRVEANTLPLLGFEPQVGALRLAALLGAVLSAGGFLALAAMLNRMARDKEAYVRMKVGPLLMEAHYPRLDGSGMVVELTSIDDLAKLADRKNSMILHEVRGATHYYIVQGDGITYCYVLDGHEEGLVEVTSLGAEEELRRGFERGEFQVYYQPIVSLDDGKITAVEALLRWQHPQRGLISAKEFIPTAEASGLIEPIGEWMLQVACQQLKAWQTAGAPMTLAVNFAERQLEGQAVNAVARVLKKTGIDPHTLQIEIPEKGVMRDTNKILSKMHELRELGIQISMDNFDGQLPVSSISQFPINNLKIDRTLIQKIGDFENTSALGEIAASAQTTGLHVVAVGVETEAQLEKLRSQLYSEAQGILLGDPAPAGEITLKLLQASYMVKPKPSKRKAALKLAGEHLPK